MPMVTFASAILPRRQFLIMDSTRPKRDWWQRGRAFDLWSIPHFLFGILAGILSPLIGMPLSTAFVFMALLAILWEWYEKLIGIKETNLNIAADFVLPFLAFTGVSFLLRIYPLQSDELLVIFSAFLILYAYTNLSGWLAFRRRVRAFMH